MYQATDEFFAGIGPGDTVAVSWSQRNVNVYDGYGRSGMVVQVADHFVAVRSPAGVIFCVGRHHLATGARLLKLNKGVATA
ncbi:MAG: hypothetical protein ACUVRC_10175 [Desulfotomaculales bacterium]